MNYSQNGDIKIYPKIWICVPSSYLIPSLYSGCSFWLWIQTTGAAWDALSPADNKILNKADPSVEDKNSAIFGIKVRKCHVFDHRLYWTLWIVAQKNTNTWWTSCSSAHVSGPQSWELDGAAGETRRPLSGLGRKYYLKWRSEPEAWDESPWA